MRKQISTMSDNHCEESMSGAGSASALASTSPRCPLALSM